MEPLYCADLEDQQPVWVFQGGSLRESVVRIEADLLNKCVFYRVARGKYLSRGLPLRRQGIFFDEVDAREEQLHREQQALKTILEQQRALEKKLASQKRRLKWVEKNLAAAKEAKKEKSDDHLD